MNKYIISLVSALVPIIISLNTKTVLPDRDYAISRSISKIEQRIINNCPRDVEIELATFDLVEDDTIMPNHSYFHYSLVFEISRNGETYTVGTSVYRDTLLPFFSFSGVDIQGSDFKCEE